MTSESEYVVRLSPDRTVTLSQIVASWRGEVRRIHGDRAAKPLDAWGVHDLFGTLINRDRVYRAESEIVPVPHSLASEVEEADNIYRDDTEQVDDLVIKLAGIAKVLPFETELGPGWWWHRIPVDGPIREDIDTWVDRLRRDGWDL